MTGYFFELKAGTRLPLVIDNLRTGSTIKWNNNALYYDTYSNPDSLSPLSNINGQKILKMDFENDTIPKVLYTNPDTEGISSAYFTIKENKLFVSHYQKSREKLYHLLSFADLDQEAFFLNPFLTIQDSTQSRWEIAYILKDSVYLKTDWNAPNGRILIANIYKPNSLFEVVPEDDGILERISPLGKNKFACTYFKDGRHIAMIYNKRGDLLKKLRFAVGKKINYLYEYDTSVNRTNFSLTSFYHPPLHYQISLESLEVEPIEKLSVPYKATSFHTKYVEYESKDGTRVPMYITCKKNIKLNGNNPVLIYGYGGYGTTLTPFFLETNALFLKKGGVLVIPNVRGGGAKGSKWADSGRRENKQNAIDDFIYSAEYLVENKYTSPDKIIIQGASHGGLLVGAAILQRPDLFKAAIAEAGPFDMLRYHKYTTGSNQTNMSEFGSSEIESDYDNLIKYSPYHNIKQLSYPNLLLITGDSDDRVPPFHSYKFLAKLQSIADNSKLYTIYITPGSGHSGALTQKDWIELEIFRYQFIFTNLDMK